MKNKNKAVITAVCVFATVAASVFGTMAYFTSQDLAVNTFTVGNVRITLNEAKVDEDGKILPDEPRGHGNEYTLRPGVEYDKDPMITVDQDSEDCWLFVKVVNGIAGIEDPEATIAKQMEDNGWYPIEGTEHYYYNAKMYKAGETSPQYPIFEKFKIAGANVTNEMIQSYAEEQVTITAYAIQAAGFEGEGGVQEAWTALKEAAKLD